MELKMKIKENNPVITIYKNGNMVYQAHHYKNGDKIQISIDEEE